MTAERREASAPGTRLRLPGLLAARLVLAGMSLALAVILERLGGSPGPGIGGVYWTIAATFFATIVSALLGVRTRRPDRFAMVQIAVDVAFVTALVYFSGGPDSVFTFLYALVVLYGAGMLDRGGAGLSVGLAAAGYGVVLFGAELGWLPAVRPDALSRSTVVLGAYWAFHAGGLLVLGVLAHALAAELRRTGDALDRKSSDLERLQDLHRLIVESIGSGLATTDPLGRITSFNPEAARITGCGVREAIGQPIEGLIPGARAVIEGRSKEALREAASGRDRLAYTNRRGEALFVGLACSPLVGASGEQLGHVVIFRDVTAIVSMENELRRSERLAAVGEMAARMAHEIRNPLASISGSVQMLMGVGGGTSPDPADAKLMGIVVREVDRLNGLIADFLHYSRPVPPALERVRLADLVREVASVGEGRPAQDLRLELELDESVFVTIDPGQIRGAIWNLWNNALEAMGGKGRLCLRVLRAATPDPSSQDECLPGRNQGVRAAGTTPVSAEVGVLELEDSGPGMSRELMERIFEPFFTTKQDGTGLGLPTVQRTIEQHGGAIELESDVGRGTRFRILLPLAEVAA